MKVGIIGATGWLGSALGSRLLSQGILDPSGLILLNRRGPQPDYHGHRDVKWATDSQDLVARSEIIVVSVRPENWTELHLEARNRLVLSFMAGVGFEALAACGGRIVRVMPNAAAEIGQSYSPWWAAYDVTEADRRAVTTLLSAIGESGELSTESQIDVMTALPGSGAAYPALMAVAMYEFMRAHGIESDVAWRATDAVVVGGAKLLAGRIQEAHKLVATYRGYRGTTAAGIEAAEAAGFSHAIQSALVAATRTSRRMTGDDLQDSRPDGPDAG